MRPLDDLIGTILSQNTSDKNSYRAFADLKTRYPNWDAARTARSSGIAAAIRRGGLAEQKAPRIKYILQELHRRRGSTTLDFLFDMSEDEAFDYLVSFPGVGPKTAACVLLFACGKPVLPVDTHVHRVSLRLGLIAEKTTAEKAHGELAALARQSVRGVSHRDGCKKAEPRGADLGEKLYRRILEFHIQLIRHGRQTCTARNPQCGECALLEGCPAGQRPIERAKRQSA